jgi:tetratricopeptide (TPR) repeat protein
MFKMKRSVLFFIILCAVQPVVFSQADTLRGEAAKSLLRQINKQLNLDTASFYRTAQTDACKCIDSISLMRKAKSEVVEEINECISKETTLLQVMMKTVQSMMGDPSEKIVIDGDTKSPEYQRYYFSIESWLRDSCVSLINAVAAHNEESYTSFSKNPKAVKEYNEGVEYMKKNDLKKAVSNFERAVKIDSKFAFAWDNLGICNRKLGNYDEAITAYEKSLEIDPEGVTPLHNIPVVYEFQKKFDKALSAYRSLQEKHPDDPEAYYGQGRVYTYFQVDLEKGLQNMCKAYNLYTNSGSPYRVDAEKNINYIYGKMKEAGNEKDFFRILKENKINPN